MGDKHVRIKSGAPWEPVMGYCRAVRAGAIVAVSGSAAVGEDYAQEEGNHEHGGDASHVGHPIFRRRTGVLCRSCGSRQEQTGAS